MQTNRFLLGCIFTALILSSTPTRSEWDGEGPVDAPTMHVGDSWVFKEWSSGEYITDIFRRRVIYVAPNGWFTIELTTDKGGDLRWVRWDKAHRHQYKHARLRLNFPLFIGNKWQETYSGTATDGTKRTYTDKYTVTKIKTIRTKAGKFKAFRIFRTSSGALGRPGTETYYYAPDLKTIVKSKPSWRYGRELLSYELAEDSRIQKQTLPRRRPTVSFLPPT